MSKQSLIQIEYETKTIRICATEIVERKFLYFQQKCLCAHKQGIIVGTSGLIEKKKGKKKKKTFFRCMFLKNEGQKRQKVNSEHMGCC